MKPRSKKLLVANWKANKSLREARSWLESFQTQDLKDVYEYVVCPPFTHLSALTAAFPSVSFGAQDISAYEAGPYTGEVPGHVLQDFGLQYAIVGHSERRKYQHETSELVAKKVESALGAGLTPILCVDVGEFEKQLDFLDASIVERVVFAYEPVHAISSFGGHEDPLETTLEHIEKLRELAGKHVHILYGGSVDTENSLMYLQEEAIDGVLVGKASLNPGTFASL